MPPEHAARPTSHATATTKTDEPTSTDPAHSGPAHDYDGVWGTGSIPASPDAVQGPPTAAEERKILDHLDVVKDSFLWLSDSSADHIASLKEDLEKADEPPMFAQVAEGLLRVALAAGTAGAGQLIAGNLASKLTDVGKEFVKTLFEQGLTDGVAAGAPFIAGGKPGYVIKPFIMAQKEGARALHRANQIHFTHHGRHKIHTLDAARALEAACSEGHMRSAGRAHYDASRDAWLAYLAQTKYGAVGRRGAVSQDDFNVGDTRTNMDNQEQRVRINKSAPGFVPETAPNLNDAIWGDAPGVLTIQARLPAVDAANRRMLGKPVVEISLLNGVNSTIRRQYEGRPLSTATVPRQLIAKVDGSHPDFELNLDETGVATPLTHARGAWLRERASLEPGVTPTTKTGLDLLLAELVPQKISGGMA